MERVLVAILVVSAIVGASSASSRVLLVDGKDPSSPALSPPPKGDLGGSGKSSPPIQLGKTGVASDSPDSPINPEKKDGENKTVALVPPSGPGTKEPQGSPIGPTKLVPPSMPEKKGQQGDPESLAPPVGPGNKDPTLAPPSRPETKKPSPPSNGDGGKDKDLNPTDISDKKGSPSDKIQEETCDVSIEKCPYIDENLVACLKHYSNVLNKFYLLVQNTGENTVSANITSTSSIIVDEKYINVSKQIRVNISVPSISSSGEIVLNTGKKNCTLRIYPSISNWKPFEQIASYATLLTPVYGAYLLILSVIIAGGIWACCRFGRGRRADSGVPYRQLEMGGIPQTNSAIVDNANTADGWENSWDDDWDEEEAVVKGSEKAPAGSASANGLSSRSRNNSNKDGWDVDWDD